ncbi:hypothetical protein BGM26_05280 [Bacillus sp. FJAT-29790]|uniref:hypothetical protein n=1 Tax=Bacillus sp. FJAT-29790 TaxID=1895002 RepID=UPI001C242BCA|nr:hypothetical protein [Bacillus sp. FJAT-29790]MBU8878400.1 hypothetical protein [Bacillus sp. FJAT-29790]
MSDHQQFLDERDRIDFLIQKGYLINKVNENLDGAFVDFTHLEEKKTETVRIGTANGRKYFSTLLFQQQKG